MIFNVKRAINFTEKEIRVNVLTVIEKNMKLPGDFIVRKPDNTIVGYIRDNGALQLNCSDPKLEVFYARKSLNSSPVDRQLITSTGLVINE